MKKKIILYCLFLCFSLTSLGQYNTQDSIILFYDSLFAALKSDYLKSDEIDWKEIENSTKKPLSNCTSFESALHQIESLFNAIEANHCQVYYKGKSYGISINEPSEDLFNEQWLKKYSHYQDGKFELQVIHEKYLYLYLPGWNFEDISEANIHRLSQDLYDSIQKLKSQYSIKAWIIDLRLNFGGNVYPMLLPLYDLLGEGMIWGFKDNKGKIISEIRLQNGVYWEKEKRMGSINPYGQSEINKKVAILTSPVTASSGEIVAMSFIGRKNTQIIGEKTYGATTSNEKRELPFGAFMALTTGIDCDRNGKTYERIIPDQEVLKGDHFDSLLLDEKIKAAIRFFEED